LFLAPSQNYDVSGKCFARQINAADFVNVQELQLKHQALEAFHETVEVFDDQLRLHDRFKKKAAPQDLPKYAYAVMLLTNFVSILYAVCTKHRHTRDKIALTASSCRIHKKFEHFAVCIG